MTNCNHESIARFRDEGMVLCLTCRQEWTTEKAVEKGLFDKVKH